MTENHSSEDSGIQESFLSHLFELRDRVVKSALAIILVFVCLVYWAPDIFHLFAQPLLQALPAGGKMIVTDVTGSFFVPMKVTMLVATSMVTFMGTKKDPVTSVTIIFPPAGKACNNGCANR